MAPNVEIADFVITTLNFDGFIGLYHANIETINKALKKATAECTNAKTHAVYF